MLLDGPSLAAIAAISAGAAVVGGIGGFGTGAILTAALAPLIGIKALIPVMAVAGALINGGRFWFYRRHLDRRMLALVLASALPFLVLGTWIYSILDTRVLGTVIGIAVIASVPLRRFLSHRAMHVTGRGLAIGSGLFGLATGITTGTGVILVTLLLGTGLGGPALLATDSLVSIALDLAKAGLFQRLSLLDGEALATGAVIGVASIPGSALAAWLVNRMHAHLHIVFIEVLVIAGGASLLWNSWR
ncbi:MAG TPA: TSUP family transporter [Burkholderiales bacterium]